MVWVGRKRVRYAVIDRAVFIKMRSAVQLIENREVPHVSVPSS